MHRNLAPRPGPGRPPSLGWCPPPLLGFAGTPHVRGWRCLGKRGSPRCPGCPGRSRTALPAAADGEFGPAPTGSPEPAGLSGCQLCCGAILRPEPARRPRMPVLQLLVGHRAPPPLPPRPSLASPPPTGPSPTSQAGSSGPALGGPASREAWLVICVATWPWWQPHGGGEGLLSGGPIGLGEGRPQPPLQGSPPELPPAGRGPAGVGGAEACPLPPRLTFYLGRWQLAPRILQAARCPHLPVPAGQVAPAWAPGGQEGSRWVGWAWAAWGHGFPCGAMTKLWTEVGRPLHSMR